jgi:SH3 domain
MLRATALFNNVSETPEELSFDAGDQLIVIEQDVGGAVGWWLCSLRGRTGIAPGNRLRLNGGSSTPTGSRFRNGFENSLHSPSGAGSRWTGGRQCSVDQVSGYLVNVHPGLYTQHYELVPSNCFAMHVDDIGLTIDLS